MDGKKHVNQKKVRYFFKIISLLYTVFLSKLLVCQCMRKSVSQPAIQASSSKHAVALEERKNESELSGWRTASLISVIDRLLLYSKTCSETCIKRTL